MSAKGQSPDNHMADLIASGAMKSGSSDVGSHNVGSSAGHPNPNGKGMASAIGGESQTDAMLKQSIDLSCGSVDSMFQGMQGSMEAGIFDSIDEGNMAPFGLMKEGAVPALQSEHMNLSQVAPKAQLSAEIQGATGIMSQSQGQSH